MTNKNVLFTPFRFVYQHSQLLAPARQILEDAEDWTDYVCAAFYLVLLIAVLYGLAVSLSTEFMLAVGGLAVTVILARIAIGHFF
jgi:hypothetical protein